MASASKRAEKGVAFGERLEKALAYHPIVFKTKHAGTIVQAKHGDLVALVKLAEKMCVDPRWLATGELPEAGVMAQRRGRMWPGAATLSEQVFRQLLDTLALTPQPSTIPDVCRYCGCTEEHGCGAGCSWVDSANTICSSCLEVQA
jgi:hypothetical protein